MMHQKLITPNSIVVVGGSDDTQKPGGKLLQNLVNGKFTGSLYVVNPKLSHVQGVKAYPSVNDLPNTDLAIIAIAAKNCLETVTVLCEKKNTRGFIIISAGFGEENEEGAILECKIVEKINSVGGSLIGPNCIGVINTNYHGVFTSPIPKLNPQGCDFISGSGATAVFILEAGKSIGLTFSSVYSVGNSAQIGVEEVLKHLDQTFDSKTSSHVKLLYMESINKPEILLKHAASLIQKGCKIAAIKAGNSDAGSRAASSHTGALANNDTAVNALLEKAGIIRCYSREELTMVASIFMHRELKGKNIAIITHAGGPAVMLTDTLTNQGLRVPKIDGYKANDLLNKLYAGSSVANPIDFLATGTAEQLAYIIDACENDFNEIDAMCIIFGSSGLFNVSQVYKLIDEKMKQCTKPIYPILPSIINVKTEIDEFIDLGHINFPDEVVFGNALAKVFNTAKPQLKQGILPTINTKTIREIIAKCSNGFLQPIQVQQLLDAALIPRVPEALIHSLNEGLAITKNMGYPLVMKVVGPIHKTDVGGVALNINTEAKFIKEFNRMIQIDDVFAILIQPMLSGLELFVGAKRENSFGHLIFCGLGGVFIEVFKDVKSGLAPIDKICAKKMISQLKSYELIKGIRGQKGINIDNFAEIISKISVLCSIAPEIFEMDINPLLGTSENIIAVDARIRIEK